MQSSLHHAGKHFFTTDFPKTDLWSTFFRRQIIKHQKRGFFDNQEILELGVGDGRNIRLLGKKVKKIIGVDRVNWKLDAAYKNLLSDGHLKGATIELYNYDAVEFLKRWRISQKEPFSGRLLICLPQSKGAGFSADVYKEKNNIYNGYRKKWNSYGLTLNAASLGELRKVVTSDARICMILSERILSVIVEKMFAETNWKVLKKTTQRVRHDWDTDIRWMTKLEDDGKRFFDSKEKPLTILEASERQLVYKKQKKFKNLDDKNTLDVFHDVSFYELAPKE